jgi:hypothetical protein
MSPHFLDQPARLRFALAMVAAGSLLGCNNLDRFDTTDGSAYCGQITDGRFVREGFQRQLELQLHIDTSRLQSVPGDLTSFDKLTGPCKPQALFNRAPLRVPQATLADPLSTLQLDESHDYNFVAWVQSTCQGPMLAVVSLMKSGAVEVRLLDAPPNANSEGSFGVFHLQRQAACSF